MKWVLFPGYSYAIPFLEKEDIENLPTRPNSQSLKKVVWEKTKGFCWYCGGELNPFGNFTIDHIIPKLETIENLVPCCRSCNSQKHTLGLEEFRKRKGVKYTFWFEQR